jgi:predicted hotdog family 3-hydroxylacyl-ACP dehydratase
MLEHPLRFAVAELLPHAGDMVLLDEVLEVGEDYIVTGLAVRNDGLFLWPDHTVPAWVGLEYMAQTVAAFSGYWRKRQGQAIDLGFLLGTRYYECSVSHFCRGSQLRVRAEKVMDGNNDMSVFDCRLEGENVYAQAKLNLLLPRDSSVYLAGKGL